MSAVGGGVSSGVGSILLMDSTITNTQTGVLIRANPPPARNDVSGTLLIDNVQANNVQAVVRNYGKFDYNLNPFVAISPFLMISDCFSLSLTLV